MGPHGDEQALAEACAAEMWSRDTASQRLGIEISEVAPGRATARMTVTEAMVQGHGSCHGGYLFTLADSAFAFACNTYGEQTVAAGADVVFLRPVALGDVLLAHARERSRSGRSGVYDVTVTRVRTGGSGGGGSGGGGSGEIGDDSVVAEFRGRSRSLGRPLLPDPPSEEHLP
jgi:acyl-CoA thioesterase